MSEKYQLVVSANIDKKYFIKLSDSNGKDILYKFSLPTEEDAKRHADHIKEFGRNEKNYSTQFLKHQNCFMVSLNIQGHIVLAHKSNLLSRDEANNRIQFLTSLFKRDDQVKIIYDEEALNALGNSTT